MSDKNRGLYNKFKVTRTDKKHLKGKRHYRCEYFVLDLDHDPHALKALVAYAQSCQSTYPILARDLMAKAEEMKNGTPFQPQRSPL